MTRPIPYDTSVSPPAPVLTVRVQGRSGDGVALVGLVDSGADCTLIPASVALRLGLPKVDFVAIAGVSQQQHRVPVHAARVTLAGRTIYARVVAFGDELIIGRDVLNLLRITLDGPRRRLQIHARS